MRELLYLLVVLASILAWTERWNDRLILPE